MIVNQFPAALMSMLASPTLASASEKLNRRVVSQVPQLCLEGSRMLYNTCV